MDQAQVGSGGPDMMGRGDRRNWLDQQTPHSGQVDHRCIFPIQHDCYILRVDAVQVCFNLLHVSRSETEELVALQRTCCSHAETFLWAHLPAHWTPVSDSATGATTWHRWNLYALVLHNHHTVGHSIRRPCPYRMYTCKQRWEG